MNNVLVSFSALFKLGRAIARALDLAGTFLALALTALRSVLSLGGDRP